MDHLLFLFNLSLFDLKSLNLSLYDPLFEIIDFKLFDWLI